jgi:GTP-binding protein
MQIRNVAIIAHVDHGKTTLVDALLRQSGAFRANQFVEERALDSNELERERGITILSKCTSVVWKDTRINIVDTPGHADFGGEVERILDMVDSAVVLVDAVEGAMPQTKFVVDKALSQGLAPIVVINKVDRQEADPHAVHEAVFDLFANLGATDAQLDFPVLFAAGRDGWAVTDLDDPREGMAPLFDLILRHVPPPKVKPNAPFSMLVSLIERDPFLGRLLTGRILAGSVRPGDRVKTIGRVGEPVEEGRIIKVLAFRGLERTGIDVAEAGDIVAIAGLEKSTVADTVGTPDISTPIPARPIDPPTIAVTIGVNDSPLSGRDGNKVTSRMIRERLFREAESNVAIRVSETESPDSFEVAGRGELQLGVVIETMRREGFELSVSRPRVVLRVDPDTGVELEPVEEVLIDIDQEHVGIVVDKLGARRAEFLEMRPSGAGKQRLRFIMPSRGLIGYQAELLQDSRGTGVMNRLFHGYVPYKGALPGRRNGVLVATAPGIAVAYALWYLEERGPMFIDPGVQVYQGMIIGEHSRGNDLDVNALRAKQLTNFRAAGKDDAVRLTPPIRMTLERAIAYIEDDELVEVTPTAIRLRKRFLDPNARKRAAKTA